MTLRTAAATTPIETNTAIPASFPKNKRSRCGSRTRRLRSVPYQVFGDGPDHIWLGITVAVRLARLDVLRLPGPRIAYVWAGMATMLVGIALRIWCFATLGTLFTGTCCRRLRGDDMQNTATRVVSPSNDWPIRESRLGGWLE